MCRTPNRQLCAHPGNLRSWLETRKKSGLMSIWKPKRWLPWIMRALCRKVPSEQRHSRKQAFSEMPLTCREYFLRSGDALLKLKPGFKLSRNE
jgi:hypothetical protein